MTYVVEAAPRCPLITDVVVTTDDEEIRRFVYTPKHGSWLNMAEIELNVLGGQCLNRRIDHMEVVRGEAQAW